MPLKSTRTAYGRVAVFIHWVSALMIAALLASGFRAANTADEELKAQLLGFHVALGITVLVLTVARIMWWWLADRKPEPMIGTSLVKRRLAGFVHISFYIVILAMAGSGIGLLVLSGAGAIIFTGLPGSLPDFTEYPPRIPHGIGARLLVLLIFFHVMAALYHHFILKDGILRRMWFGN